MKLLNFQYNTFIVDWEKYKEDFEYQEQVNYYYFQAKYTLKINKITEDYIVVKDNKGKEIKLNKVSSNEAIFHNIEFSDLTFKIHFNDKYKKCVNEDGYELILDENNNPTYNTDIIGTYNFYTYPNRKDVIDKINHIEDINLWKKYGTGPNDKSSKELRKKASNFLFSGNISLFYNYLKVEAKKEKKSYLTYEEINEKLKKFYEKIHNDNSDAYEK